MVEQQDNVVLIFFGLRALTFIEESFSRNSRAACREIQVFQSGLEKTKPSVQIYKLYAGKSYTEVGLRDGTIERKCVFPSPQTNETFRCFRMKNS